MPQPGDTDRKRRAGELLERLLAAHRHQLVRLAAAHLSDPQEAEDAVQSAALGFMRAFDPGANESAEAGALRYLKTAVVHHAYKLNRTRRRRPVHASYDDLAEITTGGEHQPSAERITERDEGRAAIAALSQRERQALGLRALGASTAEILEATGETARSLRKVIGRARRKLQDSGDHG